MTTFASYAAVLFVVCVVRTTAQLTDKDTAALRAEIALAGSFTQGTVDRTLIISGLDVQARDSAWGVRTTNTYTYGTFASEVTDNDVLSRTFLYAWPQARVYPYVMMWAERSMRRLIDMRWQPGVGITWVPFRDTTANIRLSATLTRDQTSFMAVRADGTDAENCWRGVARIAAEVGNAHDVVVLRAEGWIQPRLDELSNIRAFVDASISVRITGSLRCRCAFTYFREHAVPASAVPRDMYTSIGLTYVFE